MTIVAADLGKDKADLFEIKWLPFQLNPNASEVGTSRMRYLYQRMGKQQVMAMKPRFDAIGAECGIKFSFSEKGKTGNTLKAHRLMTAASHDATLQNKLAIELFRLLFEDDGDITSSSELVAAAKRAGMDADQMRNMLADPTAEPSAANVTNEINTVRAKYGVSGVPFFIIGKTKFSGAQDSNTIVSVLRQVLDI
jgi:predicted DsbA family dithiol-disulfide isomerase